MKEVYLSCVGSSDQIQSRRVCLERRDEQQENDWLS